MNILKAGIFLTLFSMTTISVAKMESYQHCRVSDCRLGGSQLVVSDYSKTQYPLVFAHGTSGFSSILGVMDYWHGIPQDLTRNGAQVFITQEATLNASEVLGEQLLNQIEVILAITGQEKVNLIGHSQGVQSVRYAAAIAPQKVATVTGIAGPVKGLEIADAASQAISLPKANLIFNLVTPVINAVFSVLGMASGAYYSQDSAVVLDSLNTKGAKAFNAKFPQAVPTTDCGEGQYVVNGVRYYSWTGIGTKTNVLDISDYILELAGKLTSGKSDGGVGQCSTHLGQVIRDDYNQNHLDEVNQIFGLVHVLGANPVALYRQHANRLKLEGY